MKALKLGSLALMLVGGLVACSRAVPSTSQYHTAVVILGNQPLDDATPTIDTIRRVETAVKYATNHSGCLLILTGGATAGRVSEASMMRRLALEMGMQSRDIVLEEKAQSTAQNIEFCAPIVQQYGITNALVVSKPSHLESAMPRFRKLEVFRHAQPLPTSITEAEIIMQMEEYLRDHDSDLVRSRLNAIRRGVRGID